MLVINKKFAIHDEDMLETFKSLMAMESYDDRSAEVIKIYIDYIDKIFWMDQELSKEVADKINPHLIPIVSVDTYENYCFNQLDFTVITDNDRPLKEKERKIFHDLCHRKFKNEKSLLEELADKI